MIGFPNTFTMHYLKEKCNILGEASCSGVESKLISIKRNYTISICFNQNPNLDY